MELSTALSLINHSGLEYEKQSAWADLGCGDGFFMYALSTLLAAGSTILAIDNNASALKRVKAAPAVHQQTFMLDFVKDDLPFGKLDGIMMANSLHYVKNKEKFFDKIRPHLGDDGKLLIIEYDTSRGNPWVPYPINYDSLVVLCRNNGFTSVEKIGEVPSAFRQSNIYSALIKL